MNIFKRRKSKPIPVQVDTIPKGLKHSIIPEEYLKVVGHNWNEDNKLYTNKIIIDQTNQETMYSLSSLHYT